MQGLLRRASFTGGSFAGGSFYPRGGAGADIAGTFLLDQGSLEPENSMTTFSADLSVILSRTRALALGELNPNPNPNPDSAPKSLMAIFDTIKEEEMEESPPPPPPPPNQAPAAGDSDSLARRRASANMSSAYALSLRRDPGGRLLLTQSEVLSHVWVPVFLHCRSLGALFRLCRALCLYVAVLHDSEAEVPPLLIPPLTALLMHVLFYCGRPEEVQGQIGNDIINIIMIIQYNNDNITI